MNDNGNIANLGAHRATKAHDNRLWSPVECLQDCIQQIENGEIEVERMLVLRVNKGEVETFNVGYNACNINGSTAVALLEVAKCLILADMGYISRRRDDGD